MDNAPRRRIGIIRRIDLRPVDFHTGRRLALAREEQVPCACCGRLCSVLDELETGARVGRECSASIGVYSETVAAFPDDTHQHDTCAELLSVTKKQRAFVHAGGR